MDHYILLCNNTSQSKRHYEVFIIIPTFSVIILCIITERVSYLSRSKQRYF